MPLDVHNFVNTPEEFGGIYKLTDTLQRNKERQYEIDYRHQKDAEADQWKKLNLIQNLTDLSTHQTGSDVANAVGDKLMSDIYQKYTTNADKMSPIELQANIQKDMSGIITGMEGAKNELAMADKAVAGIKQDYPGIDAATLYDHLRKDIVHRRLRDDMGGFKNEMEVPPTRFYLSDPELLSKYVVNYNELINYFTNPQGLDKQDVYTGSRENHTKFHADIPFYKKPNFNPEDVQGGFLKKGDPHLVFKSSVLPSDSLPNSKNAPFEMIDSDVRDQLGGIADLQLRDKTRKMFPDYDKMSPTGKQYAQRNVYLKTAKALDQLDFHPTEIKTPSASMLRLWMGGGSGDKKDAEGQIDLREYPDVDGGKDITSLMQGVDVTSLVTGKKFAANQVVFNPTTQRITVTDPVNNKPEEMSLTTFLQNAKPQNPVGDIKFLKGLKNPITGAFAKKDEPKNNLSQYDIPKGATVKYGADGKTPIGYELNGKKFKF